MRGPGFDQEQEEYSAAKSEKPSTSSCQPSAVPVGDANAYSIRPLAWTTKPLTRKKVKPGAVVHSAWLYPVLLGPGRSIRDGLLTSRIHVFNGQERRG